jgi:sporulation protein YlmC with PRC-barrel domain
MNKLIAATLLASAFSYPAFAQEVPAGTDPACVLTNADGTKSLDIVKCKDGKPMAASDAATGTANPAAPAANETTAATPAPSNSGTTAVPTIVTADIIAGAKIMTASDFIGKTIYAPDGTSIGEVNDFFVTNDGKVQSVVIGVGGFLGVGEKDVAVSMPSIQMQNEGENTKLVINATKEELAAAPTYDREKRVYVQ